MKERAIDELLPEKPPTLGGNIFEVITKNWVPLLISAIHLGFSGHFYFPQGTHEIGLSGLDISILNWFKTLNLLVAGWGVFLGWRLFEGDTPSHWNIKLSARFIIFFIWAILPIFAVIIIASQIWPQQLFQTQLFGLYILPYAQTVILTSLAAFFANAFSPGPFPTIIAALLGLDLALIGVYSPKIILTVSIFIFFTGLHLLKNREKLNNRGFMFSQKINFGLKVSVLVGIPIFISLLYGSLGVSIIDKTMFQSGNLEPALAKPIYLWALVAFTTVLTLGFFVKHFWEVQGTINELKNESASILAELEAVLKSSPEGIVVVQENHIIDFMNEQFGKMMEVNPKGFIGKPFFESLQKFPHIKQAPSEPEDEETSNSSTIKRKRNNDTLEWVVSPRNIDPKDLTSDRVLRMNCSRARNLDGHIIAIIGVLHDITFERRMKESKSNFVRNVSNEFRIPLATIKEYSEKLLGNEECDEKTRKDYSSFILDESKRLSKIVDSLLASAKIESGRQEQRVEFINLTACLYKVASILEPQMKLKSQKIEISAPEPLPSLRGDSDLVHQAILNLVSNAVKYSPNDGIIKCLIDWDSKTYRISVIDSGIGISAEDQKNLFQQLFRVHSAATKDICGTGLGLATVKSIMEAHHGNVEVESTLGKGSTFTLVFPAIPS